MKDIIYLDTNMINSALSQLDSGLTHSFGFERNTETEEAQKTTDMDKTHNEVNMKGKVGVGIVGAETLGKFSTETGEFFEDSTKFLEGQKEFLNRAFHDYSLDLLIEKLQSESLLKADLSDCKDGDFYLHEYDQLKFYNFEALERLSDIHLADQLLSIELDTLREEKKDLENVYRKSNRPQVVTQKIQDLKTKITTAESVKKESLKGFEMVNVVSKLGKNVFPNTTLVVSGKLINVLDDKFIRLPIPSLNVLPVHRRSHKILCRIQTTKQEDSNIDELLSSNKPAQSLEHIPKMLTSILLDSFELTDVGDVFATPYAIYYEG